MYKTVTTENTTIQDDIDEILHQRSTTLLTLCQEKYQRRNQHKQPSQRMTLTPTFQVSQNPSSIGSKVK